MLESHDPQRTVTTNPDLSTSLDMTASNDIISPETLQQAGNLDILDENGTEIKFSTLYSNKKTLVIFIRHFMCGNCMVNIPRFKLTIGIRQRPLHSNHTL
jgi:hypothetical protein